MSKKIMWQLAFNCILNWQNNYVPIFYWYNFQNSSSACRKFGARRNIKALDQSCRQKLSIRHSRDAIVDSRCHFHQHFTSNFFLYESVFCIFMYLTVCVCDFCWKEFGEKAVKKFYTQLFHTKVFLKLFYI